MKKLITFLVLLFLVTINVQSQITLYSCNNTNNPNELVGIFDLTSANFEILAGANSSDYSFSYHHTNDEAETNSNAIAIPTASYTFIPSYTVYARKQNVGNPSNYSITSITQVIHVPPTFNIAVSGQTATVSISGSGLHQYKLDNSLAFINYSAFNNIWSGLAPGNHTFTYAVEGTSCFYYYDFVINAPIPAVINTSLSSCSIDNLGLFNLRDAIPALMVGSTQNDTFFNFYLSESDAMNNFGVLTTNQSMNMASYGQVVWARISNLQSSYVRYGNITLNVNQNPIITASVNNQSVTINYPSSGIYNFSLNGGFVQSSNVFNNLPIGNNTVYATNINTGCIGSTTFIVSTTTPVLTLPQNIIFRDLTGCNASGNSSIIFSYIQLNNASVSLLTNLLPNTYSSSFHNSYNEAVNQTNPISHNNPYP